MEKSIEEILEFFSADRYLAMTGVAIDEAGDDFCRCSLEIAPMHMNAGGTVQGGAIYTLADSAFAVACNVGHLRRGEPLLSVSQSASISYLRAVASGRLSAAAHKVGGGKKSSVYAIEVCDEAGRVVAVMTGNAYAVPRR